MDILIPTILTGVFIFLLVIALGGKQKSGLGKKETTTLWNNGFEKLYDAIFQNTEPVTVLEKMGVDMFKYKSACAIIGKTPNYKNEVLMRMLGIALPIIFVIASFALFLITDELMSFALLAVGMMFYYLLAVSVVAKAESQAEKARKEVFLNLSRFTDLFHAALLVGFPPEMALDLTAKKLDTRLSREVRQARSAAQMGAYTWTEAMEGVARKFEVDQLSDFVLELITAQKKGISIIDTVARQSAEIKKSAFLLAKEKAARLSNSILVPVAIFKIFPLLLILLIPIMMQMMENFS